MHVHITTLTTSKFSSVYLQDLTPSTLKAYILAFGQFQAQDFYGIKQSFIIIYKLPSDIFSIYKSMCMI